MDVKPYFGYEGELMRIPLSRSASLHHEFSAYYALLENVFKADDVLHFGIHGLLELMNQNLRHPYYRHEHQHNHYHN